MEANYSPPSEGSGVVSYRLSKRSSLKYFLRKRNIGNMNCKFLFILSFAMGLTV
ncbi:MAG: hypothetical protein LBC74_10950 [Planctomycetaceae bacterium]|nr:hypothetical protein [Planctomycetaceae bacterium]